MTRAEATKTGNKLLKDVKSVISGKWKLRVWENLGWHCCVDSDIISIHINTYSWTKEDKTPYTCYIGNIWVEDGKTPKQAYKKAFKQFDTYRKSINEIHILVKRVLT